VSLLKKSCHIEKDCWSKNKKVSEFPLNGKNKNREKPNFVKKDYKAENKKPFKLVGNEQKLKDSKCHVEKRDTLWLIVELS